MAVLWFALTREGTDWKAATTAGTWHQLTHYLWPEIHKWACHIRWDVLGAVPFTRYQLLNLHLKLGTGEAFSASPADSAAIEGAHADSVLYVFDEAKIIPATTFDAAEGAFSGAGDDTGMEAFALAISTPGEPNGRFHEIHKRSPVGSRRVGAPCHVGRGHSRGTGERRRGRAAPRPVGRGFLGVPEPGARRVRLGRRGLHHPAGVGGGGQQPLVGTLPAPRAGDGTTLDPDRIGRLTDLGVDVARGGQDSTVFAERHDSTIAPLRRYPFDADTTVTAGRAEGILRARPARVVVDAIGLGPGCSTSSGRPGSPAPTSWGSWPARARSARTAPGNWGSVTQGAPRGGLREQLDPSYNSELAHPPTTT